MGLLSLFPRPTVLVRLPSGSFTIDPSGKVLICTLPRTFPQAWVEQIGAHVLATFRAAEAADLPMHELTADFSALKLTARPMRGGAIIFLAPQGLGRN